MPNSFHSAQKNLYVLVSWSNLMISSITGFRSVYLICFVRREVSWGRMVPGVVAADDL